MENVNGTSSCHIDKYSWKLLLSVYFSLFWYFVINIRILKQNGNAFQYLNWNVAEVRGMASMSGIAWAYFGETQSSRCSLFVTEFINTAMCLSLDKVCWFFSHQYHKRLLFFPLLQHWCFARNFLGCYYVTKQNEHILWIFNIPWADDLNTSLLIQNILSRYSHTGSSRNFKISVNYAFRNKKKTQRELRVRHEISIFVQS